MKDIPAQAQDEIRERVLGAIAGGMTQSQASRAFGVADCSIRRWIAHCKQHGTPSYTPAVRGRKSGQAGKLTPRQADKIKAIVVGKMPDQIKLPFYLWTRAAVAALIKRQYKVQMSLSSVGNYLSSWGMTAQKPVRRAYERKSEQIAQRLNERYPQIQKQAKRDKATIYWADESGLRSDDVRGRSFSLRGKPPEICTTGKRFGVSMISALSNRALAFQVFEGRLCERNVHWLYDATDQTSQRKEDSVDRRWASCSQVTSGKPLVGTA